MKSTALVSTVALLAAVFSVGASAQTGRPSQQEAIGSAPYAQSAPIQADPQVGSYARYLMLQGKPQDLAVAEARNIDHPAAARFAFGSKRAQPASQQTTQQ